MTVPLVILAVFSALAGFLGLPVLLGEKANLFSRFLESAFPGAIHHLFASTEILLVLAATSSALLGIYLAAVFSRKGTY